MELPTVLFALLVIGSLIVLAACFRRRRAKLARVQIALRVHVQGQSLPGYDLYWPVKGGK